MPKRRSCKQTDKNNSLENPQDQTWMRLDCQLFSIGELGILQWPGRHKGGPDYREWSGCDSKTNLAVHLSFDPECCIMKSMVQTDCRENFSKSTQKKTDAFPRRRITCQMETYALQITQFLHGTCTTGIIVIVIAAVRRRSDVCPTLNPPAPAKKI